MQGGRSREAEAGAAHRSEGTGLSQARFRTIKGLRSIKQSPFLTADTAMDSIMLSPHLS